MATNAERIRELVDEYCDERSKAKDEIAEHPVAQAMQHAAQQMGKKYIEVSMKRSSVGPNEAIGFKFYRDTGLKIRYNSGNRKRSVELPNAGDTQLKTAHELLHETAFQEMCVEKVEEKTSEGRNILK